MRLAMLALLVGLLSGCAEAGETVVRGDLARVRNSCALAGMQFQAEPNPNRNDGTYFVTCVQPARPVTAIRLDRFKHANQVAECARMGRDSRIEIERPGYPQVVCVRRIQEGL